MWKMPIQYEVPGFEPKTFGTRVSSHNQVDQGSHPTHDLFIVSLLSKPLELWPIS